MRQKTLPGLSATETGFVVAIAVLVFGVAVTALTIVFWDSWGKLLLAYALGFVSAIVFGLWVGGIAE